MRKKINTVDHLAQRFLMEELALLGNVGGGRVVVGQLESSLGNVALQLALNLETSQQLLRLQQHTSLV